jgi:hypothetical protein
MNVRLDEERLRKVRRLREHGVAISDLVREAIDERFEALRRPRDARDVRAFIARLLERHPDALICRRATTTFMTGALRVPRSAGVWLARSGDSGRHRSSGRHLRSQRLPTSHGLGPSVAVCPRGTLYVRGGVDGGMFPSPLSKPAGAAQVRCCTSWISNPFPLTAWISRPTCLRGSSNTRTTSLTGPTAASPCCAGEGRA